MPRPGPIPTLYITRSPYSTYTTTSTSQPLSRTTTHTTTSTPQPPSTPGYQHDTQLPPPMVLGLEIEPTLLHQETPINHIQSTPQQTDGWTCGIHMLLINLTTIYQGRIPTLTNTQQHAESLSRSHLKYVITGELDTYVTNLVHNLTNPTQHTHRTPRNIRNKHTQLTSNTKTKRDPPSPTTTRK